MSAPLHIAALGRTVRIECDDPRARRHLALVYRRLLAPPPPVRPRAAWRLERADGDRWRLRRGRRVAGSYPDLATAVWRLEFEALRSLLAGETRHVLLHGAGVTRGGGALALLGPSNAGKTAAAARLVARGGRLLSDEWLAWRRADNALAPLARALLWKADAGSPPLPAADGDNLLQAFDGRRYLAPRAAETARAGRYRIQFVELRRARGPLRRRALSPLEGLRQLVAATLNRRAIHSDFWRSALDGVAARPVLRFTGGRPDDVAAALWEVLP